MFGRDKAQHDTRLLAALQRIEATGVTLNADKCEFTKTSITFLGHKIDQTGIKADPDKTKAIRNMRAPTTVPELRRFMGMVNQLGKFTPNLTHLTQPQRALLAKNTQWVWGPDKREAFTQVKEELSQPTTLALYDSQAPTKLSADASSYGLGAVLMQQTDGRWRPVAYTSRSMTDTERRYAQIEKEALAITWGCEKFSDFILGKEVSIETIIISLSSPSSPANSWTLSPRASSGFAFGWTDSPTSSTMFQAKIFTLPTHFQEHHSIPSQMTRTWKSWQNSLWLQTSVTSRPGRRD